MAKRPIPYTVSADGQEGLRRETRRMAASALRLAIKWAGQGYTNVRVTDQSGALFEIEAFRATLPLVRRLAERRR